MNIRDVTSRLNHAATNASDRVQLLVVINAMVDDINIDSDDSVLISARCAKCRRVVSSKDDSCMNLECPFGSGIKSPTNVISLNILVNLKDDTGYLVGCRLKDAAAEEAVGVTAELLKGLTHEQRIRLKERFHQKLCSIRMQILGPTTSFQKPIYNILAINVIESDDDDQYEPLNIDEIDLNFD